MERRKAELMLALLRGLGIKRADPEETALFVACKQKLHHGDHSAAKPQPNADSSLHSEWHVILSEVKDLLFSHAAKNLTLTAHYACMTDSL